jgi:hypothetical protein
MLNSIIFHHPKPDNVNSDSPMRPVKIHHAGHRQLSAR